MVVSGQCYSCGMYVQYSAPLYHTFGFVLLATRLGYYWDTTAPCPFVWLYSVKLYISAYVYMCYQRIIVACTHVVCWHAMNFAS